METSKPLVLIVDDDPGSLSALEALVTRQGFAVATASDLAEATTKVATTHPAVVLLDQSLPDGDGLDLLDRLTEPRPEVVLVTGRATIDSAVAALRAGAADYLTKPVDAVRLAAVLDGVARASSFRSEIHQLRDELRQFGRFGAMIGRSPAMQAIYDRLARVAPTDASVLVTGESGTGKELVAATVHRLSRRSHRPLVAVHCGAISPQLIESELFGHERGSFTGADRQRKGLFERANGGTLFLDEVSEMPVELQVKFLRVLEEGTFTRVGGERPLEVDVRVVAASNRDIDGAVAAGTFRADLLYRLRVMPVELPPLRERGDDVLALSQHFLAELGKADGTPKRLSAAAQAALSAYAFPGNVRELRNVIHQSYILAEEVIEPAHLPAPVREAVREARDAPAARPAGAGSGREVVIEVPIDLAEVERRVLLATLEHLGGDKAAAAVALGISLKTVYSRLREYGSRDLD